MSSLSLLDISALSIKIPSSTPKLFYLPTSTRSNFSNISTTSSIAYTPPTTNAVTSPSTTAPYFAFGSPIADPFSNLITSPSASYTLQQPSLLAYDTPSLQLPSPNPLKPSAINTTLSTTSNNTHPTPDPTCNTPNTINRILRQRHHHFPSPSPKTTTPHKQNTPLTLSTTPLTPTPIHDIAFTFDSTDTADTADSATDEDSKQNPPKHAPKHPQTHASPATELLSNSLCVLSEDSSFIIDDTRNVTSDAPSERFALASHNLSKLRKLTDTLQGTVFLATRCISTSPNSPISRSAESEQVAVKRTSKYMHRHGITVLDGKELAVNEDILKEHAIMAYLSDCDGTPPQVTRCLDWFETPCNYYLVMEHAGADLFDFIVKAHKLIAQGLLDVKEWRKFVKYMFYQMALVVHWLHDEHRCCHMDISLENLCVMNGNFVVCKDGKVSVNPKVQLRFIDFGLAEFFDRKRSFECSKFCGKTAYKAPEIYRGRGVFDASKADVWSLGVVLFCMAVGSPPYVKPSSRDDAYKYFIKTGHMERLLFQWERQSCVTVKMLDLLKRMMCVDVRRRYGMAQVLAHGWLGVYMKQHEVLSSRVGMSARHGKRRAPPVYRMPKEDE